MLIDCNCFILFQKNCNVHVNRLSRKKDRAHFARKKKSVRSMLTYVSDLKRRIPEKFAKKTMKKINQSAAQAHIKIILPTANEINRNTK